MPEWPEDPVTVIEPDRRQAAYAADSDDDENGDDDWTQQRHRAKRRALHDDRKRRRRRIVAVLVVLGLLILPFVLAVGWFYFQVEPRGGAGETVQVTIEDGWSTGEVGSALAQADVVGSAFAFRVWSTVMRICLSHTRRTWPIPGIFRRKSTPCSHCSMRASCSMPGLLPA